MTKKVPLMEQIQNDEADIENLLQAIKQHAAPPTDSFQAGESPMRRTNSMQAMLEKLEQLQVALSSFL